MRFADFTDFELTVEGRPIRGFKGGGGPPLLLLHGSAHSSRLWESVAGELADRHSIVVPEIDFDAGRSGRRTTRSHTAALEAHAARHDAARTETALARPLGHRELASEQLAMMEALGFAQFMVCGHQDGARIAQRLALDHAGRIDRIMVLDTAPTLPGEPYVSDQELPDETNAFELTAGASSQLVRASTEVPTHANARASQIEAEQDDRELMRVNVERGDKIACPVRVLWGSQGAWTIEPLDGWRRIARDTSGRALECVPCIPEHASHLLIEEMARFFDARAC
jgi:haloacetate dehalogenase